MKADFHMHSTASDGSMAPEELMRAVHARGIEVAALTDHDSVEGLGPAARSARQLGIRFVPGIEFNTVHGEEEVHVLAYWIDERSPGLERFLAERREERTRRVEKILSLLGSSYGIRLRLEEVVGDSDAAALTRLHVARALCAKGFGTSADEAYSRYLAKGRGAYVRQESMSPTEAVTLAGELGGIAVLAHPITLIEPFALLPSLIDAGLGGIEVYYPDHSKELCERLLDICARDELLATGGSDFHGSGSRHTCDLGGVAVPQEAVSALLQWKRTGS